MRSGDSSSLQTSTPAEDDCCEATASHASAGSPASLGQNWQSGNSHCAVRPGMVGGCEGALDGAGGGARCVWMRVHPCLCKSFHVEKRTRTRILTLSTTAQHLDISQRGLRRTIWSISFFRKSDDSICMRSRLSFVHQTK